jgi:hypothetical protein
MDTTGEKYFETLRARPYMPDGIPNDEVIVASESRHFLNHRHKTELAIVQCAIFACTIFLRVSIFPPTARENLTQVFRSLEHNVIFQWGTMLHILRNSPYIRCNDCV